MKKIIPFDSVVQQAVQCCFQAATVLPDDVLEAIKAAHGRESSPAGKGFLEQYMENADIARNHPLPLCQDTGFAVWFVQMGTGCEISGGTIYEALTEGTRQGYIKGYLRKSIVEDPVFGRKNTGDNTPPVIHLELVPGNELKVILAPKGGGSENMSALKMLKPSDGREGIVNFVVDTVVNAGGNPCPPTIVGVGIGGTFEKAAFMAKKALLRPLGQHNAKKEYAMMESEILERINASGVGPQGLGGDITSFAVHIDYHPCHIASLPVAVNLNCHAARHAEFVL